VQVLADALAVTAPQPYRFVVHVHAGGLKRQWSNVSEVVESPTQNMAVTQQVVGIRGGKHLLLHDDCFPMRPWQFVPGMRRTDGGMTLITWEGRWQPATVPVDVRRGAADSWPQPIRALADKCHVESLQDGKWLHLDKSTLWHPQAAPNRRKDALIAAYCDYMGIQPHVPLTPAEAAAHPGALHGGEYKSGVGDMIAAGLSALGITKERVSQMLGKPCGCAERQASLNELGRKLGIG
jgi:hypothetical protein